MVLFQLAWAVMCSTPQHFVVLTPNEAFLLSIRILYGYPALKLSGFESVLLKVFLCSEISTCSNNRLLAYLGNGAKEQLFLGARCLVLNLLIGALSS